jgi:hypothetical protein
MLLSCFTRSQQTKHGEASEHLPSSFKRSSVKKTGSRDSFDTVLRSQKYKMVRHPFRCHNDQLFDKFVQQNEHTSIHGLVNILARCVSIWKYRCIVLLLISNYAL